LAPLRKGDQGGQTVKASALRTALPGAEAASDPEDGGLGRYGTWLIAYHVELRCRHLSRRGARRFWRSVVEAQRAAVAAFGEIPVVELPRKAERASARQSCSSS